VLENRVLRRIPGPKREIKDSRENCITRNLMTCIPRQIFTRVITSTRMRWVVHKAHWGEKRNSQSVLVEICEGKTQF
jgi:hypothetical protein